MWLTKNLEEQTRRQRSAENARVTASSGAHIDANGSKPHAAQPCVAPYGFAYAMPGGSRCVLIPLGEGCASIGVIVPENNLEPGEVMLYSSGGATIVLKNSGEVLINGKAVG
ncbi:MULTISPECIES: hypothetical protein [unclassified Ruminococcus]|uniref:hypothetical protein n=1 Tax=unclassified Ruminococcus TaxID=2608920 RepID=UPI00210E9066|nr:MULTISPECIES: hypothetical protein [unclassified Ruminococcus]MCQ4021533.1 hypothetical protein [Ruminococcus sp. zg-924]MCQ4113978.1 hypothetical protein [Ruminococcus sp. zg-921]